MMQLQDIISKGLVTENEIKQQLKNPFDNGYLRPRPELKIISYTIASFFLKQRQPRVTGIYGPRFSGKTTFLWHIMTLVFKHYTREIYFFDAENIKALGYSLDDIASYFEAKPDSKKRLIVIDNIHVLDWSKPLENLYNSLENTFFVIAGNPLLVTQLTDNIADKLYLLSLPALHFSTYLNVKYGTELPEHKEVAQVLQQALFDSDSTQQMQQLISQIEPKIKSYFAQIVNLPKKLERYSQYHNLAAYVLLDNRDYALEGLNKAYQLALYKDATKYADSGQIDLMQKIIYACVTADFASLKNISEDLKIDAEELEKAMDLLVTLDLMTSVYPYLRQGNGDFGQFGPYLTFVSPNIRLAIAQKLRIDAQYPQNRLYNDLILQLLKQLFADSVFYLPQNNNQLAFVVDDFVKGPVMLKLTGFDADTYGIDFRYIVELDPQRTQPVFEDKKVIFPLTWFLILVGYMI